MAKFTKFKGGRKRAYLKPFSRKSTFDSDFRKQKVLARVSSESHNDGQGASILYRNHVSYKTAHHKVPKSQFHSLERYQGIPDEQVPPVITVMRKLRNAWEKGHAVGMRTLLLMNARWEKFHLVYGDQKAFFVLEDLLHNELKRSIVYKKDRAYHVMHDISRIHWASTHKLPAPESPP